MPRYIASRLVQMVITIFIVSLVVFFLVRLKGDPVSILAPETFNEAQKEALQACMGIG